MFWVTDCGKGRATSGVPDHQTMAEERQRVMPASALQSLSCARGMDYTPCETGGGQSIAAPRGNRRAMLSAQP